MADEEGRAAHFAHGPDPRLSRNTSIPATSEPLTASQGLVGVPGRAGDSEDRTEAHRGTQAQQWRDALLEALSEPVVQTTMIDALIPAVDRIVRRAVAEALDREAP